MIEDNLGYCSVSEQCVSVLKQWRGGGGTLREAGGHYPGGGGRNRARAVDDRVNPQTGFRSTASEDGWPSHTAAVPRQTAT